MPMSQSLAGKRVAILVTDGFEQVELTGPKEALENAGATAEIVSAKNGEVTGWNHTTPASKFHVDKTFDDLVMNDYDAVLLPGGVVNSDTIRTDETAQQLVRDAAAANKPIAVICHGGWVDQEVVVDGQLISSRKPDDIPAFNQALIKALSA
jgi:protease I